MNILYYSVHQILEFDEIILLRRAGHFVFPLGAFFNPIPTEPFRPAPDLGEEMDLFRRKFQEMGCHYQYGASIDQIQLSTEFINLFDVCIVMDSIDFIRKYLFEKCTIPVIWRSIGVGTERFEPDVNWFAERGGLIVRYSPTEAYCSNYAGHTDIIRFGKDPNIYLPWSGHKKQTVLFSHLIKARFSYEFEFINRTMRGLTFVLGGAGNEDVQGSVGILDYQGQIQLLSQSRAYFYAAGTFIPYTLNFIEACLSGIPIVALNCNAIYSPDMCKFAEVPALAEKYGCGVLVDSEKRARKTIKKLLNDHKAAAEIGERGRRAAIDLFSYDVVTPQWARVLKMAEAGQGRLS
jgi:hypothetical protein